MIADMGNELATYSRPRFGESLLSSLARPTLKRGFEAVFLCYIQSARVDHRPKNTALAVIRGHINDFCFQKMPTNA